MKIDFSGRVAVVTGASSGIGAAYAKALAEQGADVAILARRKQKLEKVAQECRAFGVKCLPVACDVTDEASIKAAVKEVGDAFGRIDVLINNAGVCEFSLLEDHTTDQWNKVIATDLSSAFLMTREVEPYFKKQGYGRVVNTASVGALEAGPMQISYFAAKGGILQVTRALAAELAPFGVLVNTIAPGVFATEMTDGMLEAEGSLVLKNRTCLKRFAEPKELCPQMLLLASEENTYCTGQTIYVDGGLTSQL
jgi:NAD(P)-dependent dehydrogenase (short-subunit alcohol dehydrogenase family)